MATHSSAAAREKTPHVSQTSGNTISNAVRRRAEAVVKDKTIDAQSRALIRYGLEVNDPSLAELVRRVDAGETIIDNINNYNLSEENIEALAEMICRAGDEAGTKSAALLVLMAMLENSAHPKTLANVAKHLAFTRCGELNLNGMIDAQIDVLERELLASMVPV